MHWLGIFLWQAFLSWSRLDLNGPLTASERWNVVQVAVSVGVEQRYVRPVFRWLQARAPAWTCVSRLEARPHDWYRIPNWAAALHVRQRFDVYPIDVGDHVQIRSGRVTAIGYAGPTFSEIIYVLPNGEPEPDPHSHETAKARVAYLHSPK